MVIVGFTTTINACRIHGVPCGNGNSGVDAAVCDVLTAGAGAGASASASAGAVVD